MVNLVHLLGEEEEALVGEDEVVVQTLKVPSEDKHELVDVGEDVGKVMDEDMVQVARKC